LGHPCHRTLSTCVIANVLRPFMMLFTSELGRNCFRDARRVNISERVIRSRDLRADFTCSKIDQIIARCGSFSRVLRPTVVLENDLSLGEPRNRIRSSIRRACCLDRLAGSSTNLDFATSASAGNKPFESSYRLKNEFVSQLNLNINAGPIAIHSRIRIRALLKGSSFTYFKLLLIEGRCRLGIPIVIRMSPHD
jgi:hypothetical protein